MRVRRFGKRRAIALVICVVLVGVVAVVVAEFSHTSNIYYFHSQNIREATLADHIVLGAIQYAKNSILNTLKTERVISRWTPFIAEPLKFRLEPFDITVQVSDEQSKLDLNLLGLNDEKPRRDVRDMVATLLETAFEESSVQKLLDSIEEKRQELNQGENKDYKGKEGEEIEVDEEVGEEEKEEKDKLTRTIIFHTPEELLQFFEEEIKTGEGGKLREIIDRYFTAWSDGRVNLNTASEEVLGALGFSDDMTKLITERASPFKTVSEAQRALIRSAKNFNKVARYLTTQSSYLSLKIQLKGSRLRRMYEAVLRITEESPEQTELKAETVFFRQLLWAPAEESE